MRLNGPILIQCGKLLNLNFALGAGDANYSELFFPHALSYFIRLMDIYLNQDEFNNLSAKQP